MRKRLTYPKAESSPASVEEKPVSAARVPARPGENFMGNDDAVIIQAAKRPGEQSVITVNCPDKTGLGCDLCRTILEFGLRIARAGKLDCRVGFFERLHYASFPLKFFMAI